MSTRRPERTIIEAIKEVLRAAGKPMSAADIYDAIIKAKLYNFKADQPVHIVRSQLRRHCKGLDFASASNTKHFTITLDNKYYLIEEAATSESSGITEPVKRSRDSELRTLYHLYVDEFRARVLKEIQSLDPYQFERFCGNLLTTYGFRDIAVTRKTRDGGIDGYGSLKVGFAYFNVAFQCKRVKRSLGRPEIDKFRGSIQGQYEQGIFFTTGEFSADARDNAFRLGAVPIVLLDGSTIVDFMLENRFGIEIDHLPVYSLALDLAVGDEG
jgi:restriction system protein